MDGNAVKYMLIFGLCSLPQYFSDIYHVVNERKTWTEAQAYCREKYIDLVTINSTEDMAVMENIINAENQDEFWIGLYGDTNNWKWSLEQEGFYEEGQKNLRLWTAGEPNAPNNHFVCGDIHMKWADYYCDGLRQAVCYSDISPHYVYVEKQMNWTDAQKYCRANYIDLASVRSESENEAISQLVTVNFAWIGLYKESWRWSDGQHLKMTSFSKWNPSQSITVENSCVTTTSSVWNIRPCSSTYAFICRGALHKKVVKIILSKSSSSLDLEEAQDAILQQLHNKLQGYGLGEVKLRWIKQSDGKTFHLKKKDKK